MISASNYCCSRSLIGRFWNKETLQTFLVFSSEYGAVTVAAVFRKLERTGEKIRANLAGLIWTKHKYSGRPASVLTKIWFHYSRTKIQRISEKKSMKKLLGAVVTLTGLVRNATKSESFWITGYIGWKLSQFYIVRPREYENCISNLPLKIRTPTHSQLRYHINRNYSGNIVVKYETNDKLKQYKNFVPLDTECLGHWHVIWEP